MFIIKYSRKLHLYHQHTFPLLWKRFAYEVLLGEVVASPLTAIFLLVQVYFVLYLPVKGSSRNIELLIYLLRITNLYSILK